MSLAHFSCLSTGSTDSPMTLTFRRSNSGLILAMYPSSVVQTGVKSFGCENRTAQESPIHSWKRIFPWLVCASKSGAVSPIFIEFAPSSLVENYPFERLNGRENNAAWLSGQAIRANLTNFSCPVRLRIAIWAQNLQVRS